MPKVIWEPGRIMENNSLQDTSLCPPLSLPVCGLNQRSQGQTVLSGLWQAVLTYTAPALAPVTRLTGQTSVGSGGVDAFPIRAGARVTAFVNICKTTSLPLVIHPLGITAHGWVCEEANP